MVPVCLPWKSNDPGRNLNVGKRTTVTGWGRVHNNNFINRQQLSRQGVAHEILQKANLPIAKSEDCSEKFIDFNNRTQICAGGEKGKKKCYLLLFFPINASLLFQVLIVAKAIQEDL